MEKAPLMYKGWIIYRGGESKMYSAYNYKIDKHISPLFKTWELLKDFINTMK